MKIIQFLLNFIIDADLATGPDYAFNYAFIL